MKLSGAEAARYFAKPDPARAGLLIFGADVMRVALRRQQVIAALIGPDGEAEMRLTRLPAADLRKDPAALPDALAARSFFPGPRVVLLEEAADAATETVRAALAGWRVGDAVLVVTASGLTGKSTLKKLMEDARTTVCIGLYDDPPGPEEIDAALATAGLARIGREAMADIQALARSLDPGDFRQTVEKIGLYKRGDPAPLTSAEVMALAPATLEADVDDILHIVAESRTPEIAPVLRRLDGQGVAPVTLCIGATRHFRTLHAAASDPGGAAAGIARARPPVFGPRRDRMLRQAQGWGVARLEQALAVLLETDLLLRSAGQRAPAMAVMERTLIRLAMLGAR